VKYKNQPEQYGLKDLARLSKPVLEIPESKRVYASNDQKQDYSKKELMDYKLDNGGDPATDIILYRCNRQGCCWHAFCSRPLVRSAG